MSYADDLDYFAQALAKLIGRDEDAQQIDRTPPEIAAAARDIALVRMRVMCGLVTGTEPSPDRFLARNVVTDPGAALYNALLDMPMLGGDDRPGLVDLLIARPQTGQKDWQDLARAALFLEPYGDVLQYLPGPFAWKVVGDLANLAGGLPCIDEDLHCNHGIPAVDPARHAWLRLAAAQCETVGRDVSGDLRRARDLRPAIRPVHGISDLGPGSDDLAKLIRFRGADITATEIRATVRVLSEGLDLAMRIQPDGIRAVRKAAADPTSAPARLKRVLITPLATLNDGRPDSEAPRLAGDLSRHLRALHALCDRVENCSDDRTRQTGMESIAAGLQGWVRSAPGLADALDQALSDAVLERRLLGRAPSEMDIGSRRWGPLVQDAREAPPAVIQALRLTPLAISECCPAAASAGAVSPPPEAPAEPSQIRRAPKVPLTAHPKERSQGLRPSDVAKAPRRSKRRRRPDGPTPGAISR